MQGIGTPHGSTASVHHSLSPLSSLSSPLDIQISPWLRNMGNMFIPLSSHCSSVSFLKSTESVKPSFCCFHMNSIHQLGLGFHNYALFYSCFIFLNSSVSILHAVKSFMLYLESWGILFSMVILTDVSRFAKTSESKIPLLPLNSFSHYNTLSFFGQVFSNSASFCQVNETLYPMLYFQESTLLSRIAFPFISPVSYATFKTLRDKLKASAIHEAHDLRFFL